MTLLIWMSHVAAAISRFLHRNVVLRFALVGFNIFILGFNIPQGLPPAATGLGFWLDSSVCLFIILTAWLTRTGLREMMLGRDPDRTTLDEQIAATFPVYVIVVSRPM